MGKIALFAVAVDGPGRREVAAVMQDSRHEPRQQSLHCPRRHCGRPPPGFIALLQTFGNNQCQWVVLSPRQIGLEKIHDKISTDRSNGGLVGGRSHDSHGSKWSAHWRISTSSVEPEFLWPLRLPSSLLRLLSCLPHRGWLLGLLSH
jgi:hypothetical protein